MNPQRSRPPAPPAPPPANDTEPSAPRARLLAKGVRSLAAKSLGRDERRAAALVVYPEDVERPRFRGDCQDGPRPCPFVSCKHHLYLDVDPDNGTLKFNYPALEPWELTDSCALDVADRGGQTLERVGELVGVTRQRVRQIEVALYRRTLAVADHIVGRDLDG